MPDSSNRSLAAAVCVVGCGREAAGMCPTCWGELRDRLRQVGWLKRQLDILLARQSKFGGAPIGVAVRGSGLGLPLGLRAILPRDRLRNALTTWVRDLHDRHAVRWQQCSDCNARWYSGPQQHDVVPPLWCQGRWSEVIDPLTVADDLDEMARWLLRHPTWITGDVAAGELHRDLSSVLDGGWIAIDAPPDMVYLGICSATVKDRRDPTAVTECEADLYGERDDPVVRCRACGTTHVAEDRRRVLAKAVEDQVVETSVLVGLIDQLGRSLTSSAVRGMKARRSIQPKVRGDDGYIRLRQPADVGPDRFRVGDVLDALAGRAQRHPTAQPVGA